MTRGIKNNNPGNIKRSAMKWIGLKKLQSDCTFCQFTDMKYGVRAFFILMRTYRYRYGLKTPSDIIHRYAPGSENDVESYLMFLSSKGFDVNLMLLTDNAYCIFAKFVFLYESQFKCNFTWLYDIMDSEKCHVINEKKECYETTLF